MSRNISDANIGIIRLKNKYIIICFCRAGLRGYLANHKSEMLYMPIMPCRSVCGRSGRIGWP